MRTVTLPFTVWKLSDETPRRSSLRHRSRMKLYHVYASNQHDGKKNSAVSHGRVSEHIMSADQSRFSIGVHVFAL